MNVANILQRLGSGSYNVTRSAALSRVNGRVVPGSASTISITASVQPANGRDLKRLPEGFNVSDLRVVFTDTALQTASPVAGTMADKVTIGGELFEVEHVEEWSAFGGGCRAVVRRVE